MDDKPIFKVEADACVPVSAMVIDGDTVSIGGFSDEYKDLTLVSINGIYWPMCSKDGNEYEMCLGAEKDGKILDLPNMCLQCKFNTEHREDE